MKVFFPSSLLFCVTEGYVYECCVRRHKNSVNTSCYVLDSMTQIRHEYKGAIVLAISDQQSFESDTPTDVE